MEAFQTAPINGHDSIAFAGGFFVVASEWLANKMPGFAAFLESLPAWLMFAVGLLFVIVSASLIFVVVKKNKSLAALKTEMNVDALTGLLSRRGFDEAAEKLRRSKTMKNLFVVAFDIDNFTDYNSIFGFNVGDEALKHVASALYNVAEEGELFCRVDADEFCALITAPDREAVVNRLAGISKIFRRIIKNGSPTVSFGVCEVRGDRSIAEMRRLAALTKHTVKGNADRAVAVYDDGLREGLDMETELILGITETLKRGDISAFYQPKYDLKSGKPVAAEALARWKREDGSVLSSSEFVPLLEQNGLIGELDTRMFESACEKASAIYQKTRKLVRISLNISKYRVFDEGFVARLGLIARDARMPRGAIELELTEDMFSENPTRMIETVDALHTEGFLVAADGFGGGMSSLNMLKDVYFDTVKLDAVHIKNADEGDRSLTLFKTVAELCKNLGVKVVAENVETAEQLEFLRKCGCVEAQGTYFSPAVESDMFDYLIGARKEIRVAEPVVQPEPEPTPEPEPHVSEEKSSKRRNKKEQKAKTAEVTEPISEPKVEAETEPEIEPQTEPKKEPEREKSRVKKRRDRKKEQDVLEQQAEESAEQTSAE